MTNQIVDLKAAHLKKLLLRWLNDWQGVEEALYDLEVARGLSPAAQQPLMKRLDALPLDPAVAQHVRQSLKSLRRSIRDKR
jgi:hypothetical protein